MAIIIIIMLQSRGGGMDKEIFITTLQVCLFEAPD
jgi:hypothetical protein